MLDGFAETKKQPSIYFKIFDVYLKSISYNYFISVKYKSR